MSRLICTDIVLHLNVEDYERRVIEASRRLAENGVVRRDYQHLPWEVGLQKTHNAIRKLEERGHLESR